MKFYKSILANKVVAPIQRRIQTRKHGGQNLRRSTSLRICDKRSNKKASLLSKDDLYVTGQENYTNEDGPSPPPAPCPALRGHYDTASAPMPPQRTVSFLVHQKLPQKVAQRPLPAPPTNQQTSHVSFHSDVGLYDFVQKQRQNSALHSRSYSSPAPLSPPPGILQQKRPSQDHMIIEIPSVDEEAPLPPPPYISPP